MQNDIVVNNWEELQRTLFHDVWDAKLQRFRSSYVYRGLSDTGYDLKTNLIRLEGPYDMLEGHLLRNFRKYAHHVTLPGNSIWNWLAMAQHHGLPTRLLDWTYSPYIALHFATANLDRFHEDGVIWAVNYVKCNQYLPSRLKVKILDEGSNTFTAEMLDDECKSLKEFDFLQREEFVVFFEPPSLDNRIVNQHALFSMMSSPEALLDKWLASHPDIYFRIVIPAGLKWEIRDKLDQANITERVLFPGLEGISKWLKRHYSPKK